jgi:hypothetical protein
VKTQLPCVALAGRLVPVRGPGAYARTRRVVRSRAWTQWSTPSADIDPPRRRARDVDGINYGHRSQYGVLAKDLQLKPALHHQRPRVNAPVTPVPILVVPCRVCSLKTFRTGVSRHAGLMSQVIEDGPRVIAHVVEGTPGDHRCRPGETTRRAGRT